ncbi:hypothetical protein M1P56_35055 (plasmid) [Streptomyces sp. HU2014]|uniref:flavoprotein n=1 Tax=Streptomyces sp. HU2014 TaxID=2939414 RepID=UPI00200C1378|nr:flavoprotein [Streptomyces sp. HU2014]UQI49737.1 hypothetical protein M1P56_35055 [Streptomyces sp. HU2014]
MRTDGAPPVGHLTVVLCGSASLISLLPVLGSLRAGIAGRLSAVASPAALRWLPGRAIEAVLGAPVYTDPWDLLDHQPAHTALGEVSDVILVAPATADTLAACAQGRASTLAQLLVLNAACPVGFVPVMNQRMWTAPAVQRNAAQLRADGHDVLEPSGRGTARTLAGREEPGVGPYDIRRFVLGLSARAMDAPSTQAAEGAGDAATAG